MPPDLLMDGLGIDTAYINRVGSVSAVEQDRKSLDQDRLKEELLKSGVPAEVIVRSFSVSTKTSHVSSVRFSAK